MSQAEVKRFFSDMANQSDLKEAADKATKDGNLEGLSTLAKSKNYDITGDDLKQLAASNQELSDEQLEAVAGGWSVSVGYVVCVSS
jgi:predicted ribosomally synthesized peptide with nif11-like leader